MITAITALIVKYPGVFCHEEISLRGQGELLTLLGGLLAHEQNLVYKIRQSK